MLKPVYNPVLPKKFKQTKKKLIYIQNVPMYRAMIANHKIVRGIKYSN